MVEFDIPYDHFTEVITNSCLDFNLGVIYPSNCLNFSLLGFEGESSWLLWKFRPEHTLKMCVLVFHVLFNTNLFQVCRTWSLCFTQVAYNVFLTKFSYYYKTYN
ncbi:hypothetical protein Hanom_Chr11g00993001 [Helianthus anomalus]